MKDTLLTTHEAALALELDIHTTRKVLLTEIPARIVGRSYLWSPKQIAALKVKLAARAEVDNSTAATAAG